MIAEAIRTLLVDDAEVAEIVAARVYPLVLPQSPTLPAITLQRVSNQTVISQDGPGMERPRIQVDCWASTYLAARELAAAVKACLCPSRHETPNYVRTVDDVRIEAVMPESDRDLYEDDTQIYRVSMDFFVFAVELAA